MIAQFGSVGNLSFITVNKPAYNSHRWSVRSFPGLLRTTGAGLRGLLIRGWRQPFEPVRTIGHMFEHTQKH